MYTLKGNIDGLTASLIAADFVGHFRRAIEATYPGSPLDKRPLPKRIAITISL